MNWLSEREIFERKRSLLRQNFLNYLEEYLDKQLYKDEKSFRKFCNMRRLLRGDIKSASLTVLTDVERILQQIKYQVEHEKRKTQPIKSIIDLLDSDNEDELPEKNASDSETSFREPSPICVMDIEEMRRKEEEAKNKQDSDSDSDCEIIEVNKEDSIIEIRESPEREISDICENEESNSKDSSSRNSFDSIPRPRSPIINVPKTTNDHSFCDSVLSALRAEIAEKEASTEKENSTQNVSYLPSTSGLINRFAADQRKQISETAPVEEENSEDDEVVEPPRTTRPGTFGQRRKSISEESNPLSTYKLKKTALKPASHYAKPKPTNQVRKTLSVKEKPVEFRPRFNPIDEAVAVSKIKQRLYQKTYLDPNNIVKQIAAGKIKPTKDANVENDGDSRESIENSPENSQDSATEILDVNKNKNLIKDYIKNKNYRKRIARESRLEKKQLSEKNHTKAPESKSRKTSEKSKSRKSSESEKKSSGSKRNSKDKDSRESRSKSKDRSKSSTKSRSDEVLSEVSISDDASRDSISSLASQENDSSSGKSPTTSANEDQNATDSVTKFVSMSFAQNIDIVLVKIVDIFVTDYLAGKAPPDKVNAFQGLVGDQKYAEIMKLVEARMKSKSSAEPEENSSVTDRNRDNDLSSEDEEEENNETVEEHASTSKNVRETPIVPENEPTDIPNVESNINNKSSVETQLTPDNIEMSGKSKEPAVNQPSNEIGDLNQSSKSPQSDKVPESVTAPATSNIVPVKPKRGRPRKVAFVEQPKVQEKEVDKDIDPEGLLELLPEKAKKGRRKTVDSLIYDMPLSKRRQSCDSRKRRRSTKESNNNDGTGNKKKKNEEEVVIKTEPTELPPSLDESVHIVFKTEKEFDDIVNEFSEDIEETVEGYESANRLQEQVA